jgi:hypothetical protein
MSKLSEAATGAVEASFADIADGLLDTESLIEAAHMAASAVEEEMAQSALKRLLDVIKNQTRDARKEFEIKYGNPIYRQHTFEKEQAETAGAEVPPAEQVTGAVNAVDLLRVYDTLTLTKGLFEAAEDVSDARIALDQRGAMDAALYALREKVSDAETEFTDLVQRMKAGQP